jgi:farnesyl-diphosphate farnesyltransferase
MRSNALLRSVSRSFYLSLRVLPASVRPTLSLAYLLARASDSIADAPSLPAETRSRLLRGLPQAWNPTDPGPLPETERSLLAALPELLRELQNSPDRDEILSVWTTILSGQTFDLQRFGAGSVPLSLEEAARYTGLVAGCVGEFWTRICFRHIPVYATARPDEMCRLGYEFGCGLQWVNILRDRHADAASGRCYVTEENFGAALRIARDQLDAGSRYASLVRPRRIRIACRMPLEIGRRTLDLVASDPQQPGLKVGRRFVWFSLLRTLCH